MNQASMMEGDLVVVPTEPALGVGRIERFLPGDRVRVHFYDSGDLLIRPVAQVARCPAGVWDRRPSTQR